MNNNKLSKRDSLKIQIENNKKRLALSSSEELAIWGEPVRKLVELGEFIVANLDAISDDEIESYWSLFKMAESVHDVLKNEEIRKKDAQIFAACLDQTINYYKQFHSQILSKGRLPEAEYEKERLTIQNQIDNLAMDFTMLPIRYMFSHRDLKKNPYIGNDNTENSLKNYELYYAQLKEIYHGIEEEIRSFVNLVSNQVNKDIIRPDLEEIKQELIEHRYLTNLYLECLKPKDLATLHNDKTKLEQFLTKCQTKTETLSQKNNLIFK